MPKYYVSSGDLNFVQQAENEEKAAVLALKRWSKFLDENDCTSQASLGLIFRINETGFEYNDYNEKTSVYTATERIVKEANLQNRFNISDKNSDE
jgi:hypothetical protein